MKNVAGYDVSRLMAGSLGTLGLIIEVSLKVLPLPVAEATLRFELPQDKALELMNRWAGQPLPLSATCWHDDVLTLRLSGAGAAVASACSAARRRKSRRRRRGGFLGRACASSAMTSSPGMRALWRLSVPSVAGALDLPGPTLIEWGGAQRWLRCDGADCDAARAAARRRRPRHAVPRRRQGDRRVPAARTGARSRIHRDLKRAFDPHGIFNPGRLYPDF